MGNINTVDFLTHLETPFNNALLDSPQVIVPAHVLNDIVVAQNNLSNIAKDLSTKKIMAKEEGEKDNGEDTLITRKGLRHNL